MYHHQDQVIRVQSFCLFNQLNKKGLAFDSIQLYDLYEY